MPEALKSWHFLQLFYEWQPINFNCNCGTLHMQGIEISQYCGMLSKGYHIGQYSKYKDHLDSWATN